MNEPTPGPWLAERGTADYLIRPAQPDHLSVGRVWTEADARLCIAAPDLLAALKETADELAKLLQSSPIDDYIDANDPVWGVLDAAAAAIAKAEGREQAG